MNNILYIIKFIYSWLLPPGCIILSLAALNVWLYQKHLKAAKILSLIILVFYLFSTGYVSGILIRNLESEYKPPTNPTGDVIVILGGGATLDTPDVDGLGHLSGYAANRVLTGAILQKKLQIPIIVAGGQVYNQSGNEAEITKRLLIGLGIDSDKIFIENQSLNTRQNAENAKEILDSNGFKKPILITSAFHLKRSAFYFEKTGIQSLPYPADYQVNVVVNNSIQSFIPNAGALERSCLALKEYLGLAGASLLNY